MLHFGVTIPATVPQGSEIPEGIMNNPVYNKNSIKRNILRGADKSLARPGRKQATETEDFEFHISYL